MKFTIQIVNKRNAVADFDCDRSTVLGNPYPMQSEAQRDAVCDRYESDRDSAGWDDAQLKYLRRIWQHGAKHGSVSLGCWCYPKRCHCETIKTWLESKMS